MKPLVCPSARRNKRNHQEPGNSVQGWHFGLGFNCLYVANDPMRLIPRLAWLGFRIIYPGCFVFPSGRKLQSVLSLAHGVLFLKGPDILQDERLSLLFVFVSDDISRLGGGDAKHFHFYVRHELASIYLWQRYLDCLLIFHFVVFALRWDAPSAHARDFLMGIERNYQRAKFTAAGSQNLVGLANCGFDLVRRLNHHYLFGIKLDYVRLLVVRRQRYGYQRVHPCWSVTSDSRPHRCEKAENNRGEYERYAAHFSYSPPTYLAAPQFAGHLRSLQPDRS